MITDSRVAALREQDKTEMTATIFFFFKGGLVNMYIANKEDPPLEKNLFSYQG